jgi:hypothetical protein
MKRGDIVWVFENEPYVELVCRAEIDDTRSEYTTDVVVRPITTFHLKEHEHARPHSHFKVPLYCIYTEETYHAFVRRIFGWIGWGLSK